MIPAEFIRSQLAMLAVKKTGPTSTFVLCPFHGEKTPSGRIQHDSTGRWSGSFKCFGCGRTAKWNEVAKLLGLEAFGKSEYVKERDVPSFKEDHYAVTLLSTNKSSEKTPVKYYPLSDKNAAKIGLEENEWRGYDVGFLRETIGVDIMFIPEYGRHYLRLPVIVNGKLRGWAKAQLFKPKNKKFPSYLNKPGTWVNTHGLFPFDASISLMRDNSLSTVVIVEGQRDALRLIREGIPAMCMMGTQSWSDSKSRLLEFAGVTRVILLMDGDDAGKKATRFLKTGFRLPTDEEPAITPLSKFFILEEIRLWTMKVPEDHPEDKLDPGNMPQTMLKKLKKLAYDK